MANFLNIHVLQTLPPSLVNRDQSGAPKTAIFGGVSRQRISSQSLKRAVREDMADRFDDIDMGSRTRRPLELVGNRIQDITAERGEKWDLEKTIEAVTRFFKTAGFTVKPVDKKNDDEDELDDGPLYPRLSYALFLSEPQVTAAAEFIVDTDGQARTKDGKKINKKETRRWLKAHNGVPMSLFGRMIADLPEYNVDASVQVAHALGVHPIVPEVDFYTTVDDHNRATNESGGSMMGDIEFASSTFYRYAGVNLDELGSNLGDADLAPRVAAAFADSFITTLPSAKANSFAHYSLPELVYVTVDNRPITLVGAFESPIMDDARTRRQSTENALVSEVERLRDGFGITPRAAWSIGSESESLGETISLPDLTSALESHLTQK